MAEISNLELKFQLTNEHLRTPGVIEKIPSTMLLRNIMDVKYDEFGKPIPSSIGPALRAYMTAILHSHTMELPCTIDGMSEYQSILQKSYSFDQQQISSIDEFEEIYERYSTKTDILFRGVREASWRLYNSLQRHWINSKLYETESSYLELLQKMIEIGKTKHNDTIKSILLNFNIDSLNDLAVLGFLQHHSCPTPFLDWTYSFDVALYFAIDGVTENTEVKEIQDYISVYWLEEEHFSKGGYKELLSETVDTISSKLKTTAINLVAKDEDQAQEMEEKFKDRSFFDKDKLDGSGLVEHMTKVNTIIDFPATFISDKDKDSGLIFSLANSPNVINQKGCFMWNSHPYKPLEVVGIETYREHQIEIGEEIGDFRFCRCLNIHKDLIGEIKVKLEAKGITKDYIYASKNIDTWEIFEQSKKSST